MPCPIALTPSVLRTLSQPEPPSDLHTRIAAAMHLEAVRRQRRRHFRRALGLTAVLALIVVLRGGVR